MTFGLELSRTVLTSYRYTCVHVVAASCAARCELRIPLVSEKEERERKEKQEKEERRLEKEERDRQQVQWLEVQSRQQERHGRILEVLLSKLVGGTILPQPTPGQAQQVAAATPTPEDVRDERREQQQDPEDWQMPMEWGDQRRHPQGPTTSTPQPDPPRAKVPTYDGKDDWDGFPWSFHCLSGRYWWDPIQ